MLEINKIYLGDCLELMECVDDKSINMILCDLPFGSTSLKWDVVIPFEPLWKQYKRIIKDNGAIVLFGIEPFSSMLRMSNLEWFRYDWIWDKVRGSNIFNAKDMPLKQHENISVFYKSKPTYNPQPRELKESTKKRSRRQMNDLQVGESSIGSNFTAYKSQNTNKDFGYPQTILTFTKESNNQYKKVVFHPTQKPEELYKYLINTYSNEGDLILDNCCGSGTIGVAKTIRRNFIGIEKQKEYYDIAVDRMTGFICI